MINSKIEWTDHTFNPWEGCTKVSPGCLHCYAETRNARFGGGTAPNWGKGAPRRRTSPANWNKIQKLDRDAFRIEGPNARPRVFCASLADWLDDEVPLEWLIDLLDLIRTTPNLDWLLLTKRPQNWRPRLEAAMDAAVGKMDLEEWIFAWLGQAKTAALNEIPPIPPANVWVGTTVEDQTRADERIPILLQIPARIRFLSCEPLLGPVRIFESGCPHPIQTPRGVKLPPGAIHWVIAGGESGPGARPMHPEWARSLRDQCAAAGVAFLFKQWGEWVKYIDRDKEDPDWRQDYTRIKDSPTFCFHNLAGGCGFHGERLHVMQRVGKHAAGRQLDGIEHNAIPAP